MKSVFKKSSDWSIISSFLVLIYFIVVKYKEAPLWKEVLTESDGKSYFTYGYRIDIFNAILLLIVCLLIFLIFFLIIFYLYNSSQKVIQPLIKEKQLTEIVWTNGETKIRFKNPKEFIKIEKNQVTKGTWEYFEKNKTIILVTVNNESLIYEHTKNSIIEKVSKVEYLSTQ